MSHLNNEIMTTPLRLDPSIELSNGDMFSVLSATQFDIKQIAHSLSMMCRFGGQCKEFYSVAQHSMLVAKIMKDCCGNPMEGLLHDAAEFVMGDLATPIKYACQDYNQLEKDLQRRANEFFGLPPKKSSLCEMADKVAMFMEAYSLIPSKGETFGDPLNLRATALYIRNSYREWLAPMDWKEAREEFMICYRTYKNEKK